MLKELGYRKLGRHFFLQAAESSLHIRFKASQFNIPEKTSFTINLWSYSPEVAKHSGDTVVLDPAKQRFGHAGSRIGHLLPIQADFWWAISSVEDTEAIANEVNVALREFGLPYLEKVSTLQGIAELSTNIPKIGTMPSPYRASALFLLGRIEEAMTVLEELRIQRERARAPIDAVKAASNL